MSKEYRPWRPGQSYLLPPSPHDWLPKDHLAYFVMEVVGELDLTAVESVLQAKDGRGTRPYSPRMMTALILYAYASGVFSSRKIERATHEDVAFRVIAADEHPHFTTINEFRLQHREALASLFTQVLTMCGRAGLASLGHVALDGSKVHANASKHKAMSYSRMKDEEKRLMAEVESLLFKADETDRLEDEQYGAERRGDQLPEVFRDRESRLRFIRETKAALEKEAAEARATELKEQAERATTEQARRTATTKSQKLAKQSLDLFGGDDKRDDDDDSGGAGATTASSLPRHRIPTTQDGKPTEKAQRNFTDPDSRIMVRNGTFLQAFNAQVAVNAHQVIVANAVTNQPQDPEHLIPMMERVRENCGATPDVLSADAGYFSERNVVYCEHNRIDAHIAVARKQLDDVISGRRASSSNARRLAMQQKLLEPQGRETYAKRKSIVEPVFGQIKRILGFRQFSLRGLAKVPAEWAIVCTTHNLLKLFRRCRSVALAAV